MANGLARKVCKEYSCSRVAERLTVNEMVLFQTLTTSNLCRSMKTVMQRSKWKDSMPK